MKDSDGAKGTRDVLSYQSVQRMIPSQHIQEMFQNVVNCPGTAETTISNKQLFPTKQWTGCQPRSQVQWFQRRANTTNWDAISPFNRCKGQDKGYVGWIQNHITSQSALTMQQFRVYVHERDHNKRSRILGERQMTEQGMNSEVQVIQSGLPTTMMS